MVLSGEDQPMQVLPQGIMQYPPVDYSPQDGLQDQFKVSPSGVHFSGQYQHRSNLYHNQVSS